MANSTSLGGVVSRSRVAGLEFDVLGDVTAVDGVESLSLGGQKQRAVLAMLIANAGKRVPSDRLVEAVYGDPGAERGRRRVQTYVSTLRSVVGDAVVKDGSGWRLAVERTQIDALRFEDLYESVRDSASLEPETVTSVLRESLELWRGHPYADIEAHGLLDAEIARLNELRVSTLAARLDADLAAGRDADLVGEVEALMIEHPFQERFRAHHMLALYRAGRQREAMRSFDSMRQLLIEEIGADPSPELRELERRILEQDPALALQPTRSIRRRAILVADSGDPLEMSKLPTHERDASILRCSELIRISTDDISEGEPHVSGNAIYTVLDSVGHAVSAATSAQSQAGDAGLRIAIDWGDLEVSEDGVSGPPVSRVAVLVSVAHRGQVLLSSDAQQTLTERGGAVGARFEMLGTYDLVGIEEPTPIFQLLVGDHPRSFPPLVTDRTPPPLPGRGGLAVPGYEMRDAVGVGSVGTLYRAYQPSVGREVLIEVIGRSDAADPDFIRQFEPDAQRLNLLDHPSISPPLDYWRAPDGACLVYRHHRGGFLGETTAPVDGARIVEQIGTALAHAHSLGIVHGSVRPDRIALDQSGNAYLLGFPLAGVPPRSNPDHAGYIAPETVEGSAPSVATDVFALGVLAHEMLSGEELPDDASLESESSVIARAVSENPDDRMSSVAEFLIKLNPDGVDSPHTRFTETRNPYKGLAAFHEADSSDFFGRDAVVDELIASLSGSHLLAVVGPSGIGKSSVVRAGLVPTLRSAALPGSDGAVITAMLPGSHPFVELQRAIERVAIDVPSDLRERLADHDQEALADLRACLPERAELVVIIDQFEELFTMTDSSTAGQFLDLLVSTLAGRWARVVITLRADFLDRPLLHSAFGELLRRSMVVVRSPNLGELVQAITGPARAVGVTIDAAVAERIANEVLDRPGALPLLQHALSDLFEARLTDRIDVELYEQRGGVTGSLARRAESVFDTLGATEKSAVKQVFLRLLTVADGATPTRRRVRLSTLDDLGARTTIDLFVRSRLLVLDTDPDARTPTVEVAHEALLIHWPRLAAWIDTAREDLTFVRRLDEAIREWEANDRDDIYLFTGGRLAQYETWMTGSTIAPSRRDQEFLQRSTAHDVRLRARSRRRRNRVTAAFAAAAVIASALGVLALRSANRANEKESEARAESLAANAIIAIESDPELGLLLASEALHESPGFAPVNAAHQALQRHRAEMIIPVPDAGDGAFATISPSGEWVAVVGVGSAAVEMWRVGASEAAWEVELADAADAAFWAYMQLWFSEDGQSVYVPLHLGTDLLDNGLSNTDSIGLYTLDAATGARLDFLRFDCLTRAGPAGGHFASANAPFAVDAQLPNDAGGCIGAPFDLAGVLDVETGELLFEVEAGAGRPPTLSADGRFLGVTGFFGPFETEGGSRVFDLQNGGEVVLENDLLNAVISEDGTRLLSGQDPTHLFDLATGSRLQTYQGDFNRVGFTVDGDRVFGVGSSGAAVIFDTETGVELIRLRGHTEDVRMAAVDATGSRLVTSSPDSARVWDIASTAVGHLPPIPLPSSSTDHFLPDALTRVDDHLLVRRGDVSLSVNAQRRPHRIEILDLDGDFMNGRDVWVAELGPGGILFEQAVSQRGVTSPDGEQDAVEIDTAKLIDVASGGVVELQGSCAWYWIPATGDAEAGRDCAGGVAPVYGDVAFAADGSAVMASEIATEDHGPTTIWDARTGEVITSLAGDGLALSPDGRTVIVQFFLPDGDDNVANVVDVATGATVSSMDTAFGRLQFDTASGRLVGETFGLAVVDPETWSVTTFERPSGGAITDIAVSPSGRLVATTDKNEFVVVWDLEAGRILAALAVDGQIGEGLRGVDFLNDQTLLVAPEQGEALLQFTLDPSLLRELALESLNRGFRPEECRTYDIDPCPTLAEMRARE